jgi:hypothetical protein
MDAIASFDFKLVPRKGPVHLQSQKVASKVISRDPEIMASRY